MNFLIFSLSFKSAGFGNGCYFSIPQCIHSYSFFSAGRKVAVDASMCIYQFLIAVRQEGAMLTNEDGETTRYSSSYHVICSKISNTFLFVFFNIGIANREDTDQTASSDLGLCCFSR